VLGSTDPTIAAEGSLRKAIFTHWKKMGLATEPNVGDNGVHASASPFEALCERLNWVGERHATHSRPTEAGAQGGMGMGERVGAEGGGQRTEASCR
jgi:hypothetical protein